MDIPERLRFDCDPRTAEEAADQIDRLTYALRNLIAAVDSGENISGAMALAKGILRHTPNAEP